MADLDEVDALSGVGAFAAVPRDALAVLAMAAQRETFEPGEFLAADGAAAPALLIVVDGLVDRRSGLGSGSGSGEGLDRDGALQRLAPPRLLCARAVLNGDPHQGDLIAVTAVTALRIEAARLDALLATEPALALGFARALASTATD